MGILSFLSGLTAEFITTSWIFFPYECTSTDLLVLEGILNLGNYLNCDFSFVLRCIELVGGIDVALGYFSNFKIFGVLTYFICVALLSRICLINFPDIIGRTCPSIILHENFS